MAVFWVAAPCSLVEIYRRVRGAYCLHHQGSHSHTIHMQSIILIIPILFPQIFAFLKVVSIWPRNIGVSTFFFRTHFRLLLSVQFALRFNVHWLLQGGARIVTSWIYVGKYNKFGARKSREIYTSFLQVTIWKRKNLSELDGKAQETA
jgi:hypothetical protein